MKLDVNLIAHIYQHGELEEKVNEILAYEKAAAKDNKIILEILDQLLEGGTQQELKDIVNKIRAIKRDIKTTI